MSKQNKRALVSLVVAILTIVIGGYIIYYSSFGWGGT